MRIGPPFPKFTVAVIYDASDSSLLFQKLIAETEDHSRHWHFTSLAAPEKSLAIKG
jgi:hypothetical protein